MGPGIRNAVCTIRNRTHAGALESNLGFGAYYEPRNQCFDPRDHPVAPGNCRCGSLERRRPQRCAYLVERHRALYGEGRSHCTALGAGLWASRSASSGFEQEGGAGATPRSRRLGGFAMHQPRGAGASRLLQFHGWPTTEPFPDGTLPAERQDRDRSNAAGQQSGADKGSASGDSGAEKPC